MKKIIVKFVERNDANKQFENHLSASVMGQIYGGEGNDQDVDYCDPWSSCDSWNCNPDCHCKSSLA